MSEIGKKFDNEKVRMELLPMDVLEEIAKILTYGAKKYGPNNWQKLENAEERYKGALLRHLAASNKNSKDKESGLSHTAHMACNAIFLLWFEINKKRKRK